MTDALDFARYVSEQPSLWKFVLTLAGIAVGCSFIVYKLAVRYGLGNDAAYQQRLQDDHLRFKATQYEESERRRLQASLDHKAAKGIARQDRTAFHGHPGGDHHAA